MFFVHDNNREHLEEKKNCYELYLLLQQSGQAVSCKIQFSAGQNNLQHSIPLFISVENASTNMTDASHYLTV